MTETKFKPTKLDPNVKDYYQPWIAHPDGKYTNDEVGNLLIERRFDLEIFGTVDDPELSYEYDEWALVRLGKDFYFLRTSGCSCPSPSETWGVDKGPATISAIREHIQNGEYSGYSPPSYQMKEFMKVLDNAEKFVEEENQ